MLEGIAFVLSTGIGWTKLPRELGYGSGWTCWRWMCEWTESSALNSTGRNSWASNALATTRH